MSTGRFKWFKDDEGKGFLPLPRRRYGDPDLGPYWTR